MRIAIAIVLASAGCDRLFGVNEVTVLDAGTKHGDGLDAFDAVDAPIGPPPSPYIAPGDYDHDGEPNETDPCPTIPNEPKLDTDGDGIPDACDPNINVPATSKDCIVLFDGLRDDTALDPRWMATTSGWALSRTGCTGGGGPGWCSPLMSPDTYAYFAQPLEAGRVDVEAVESVETNSGDDEFHASARFDPATISGRECGLDNFSGVVDGEIEDLTDGVATHQRMNSTLLTTNAGTLFEVTWVATTRTCTVQSGGTLTLSSPTPSPTSEPDVAIHVRQLGATVRYVLAWGTRCP